MVLIRRDEGYWRKYAKAARAGLIVASLFCLEATSNPPSPSVRDQHSPPQAQENKANTQPNQNIGDSANRPFFVQVEPTPQTNQEAYRDSQKQAQESFDENWTLIFTGFSTVIFLAQLIVFGIQARVFWIQADRLKDSIIKMGTIADGQTADMAKSITEAARAATAMEDSAAQTKITLETIRKNAATELRAYINFEFITAKKISRTVANISVRFQNYGKTPAYEVCGVCEVTVEKFPFEPDSLKSLVKADLGSKDTWGPSAFGDFPLSIDFSKNEKDIMAEKMAVLVRAVLTYKDAFGVSHKTNVRRFSHGRAWNDCNFAGDSQGNDCD